MQQFEDLKREVLETKELLAQSLAVMLDMKAKIDAMADAPTPEQLAELAAALDAAAKPVEAFLNPSA